MTVGCRPFVFPGETLKAEIPLIGRHGAIRAHAIVDPSDFDYLSQFQWHLHTVKTGARYAMRWVRVDGKSVCLGMHRDVLGLPATKLPEVDHISRDGLDNRRQNLRIATHAQNHQNRSVQVHTSRFRGVFWDRRTGKWRAQVKLNGKPHHLGRFASEEEAAAVAMEARVRLMPYTVES